MSMVHVVGRREIRCEVVFQPASALMQGRGSNFGSQSGNINDWCGHDLVPCKRASLLEPLIYNVDC